MNDSLNESLNLSYNQSTNGSIPDGGSGYSGIGLNYFDAMSLLGRFDYAIMLFALVFAFFSNSISIHTFTVRPIEIVPINISVVLADYH